MLADIGKARALVLTQSCPRAQQSGAKPRSDQTRPIYIGHMLIVTFIVVDGLGRDVSRSRDNEKAGAVSLSCMVLTTTPEANFHCTPTALLWTKTKEL